MDLILTHANADFDAVASQLAAHKLWPQMTPVLSPQVNRNVQHFLALYWDELPFWRLKDLPRQHVDQVLVVDTQTVQTVRGMDARTQVRIVDHHPLTEDLDPAWQVAFEALGATTTILCEELQARGGQLSRVEATLLLLGIYEDTGSLGYASTTPRDAQVVAWLMSQRASLDVMNDFLHRPLAEDQRRLYERLLENAQTVEIEGYSIVITCAPVPDVVEEIATLAHKLSDLLEPSALFMLVDLGAHVQLVARSAVDAVDVSRVAEYFGGGGHGRAAAAIIRGKTLEEARHVLLELLPDVVRPGLTVADLMSYGVQTLSSETRVREAAARMRRYSYEGYPVVDEGRIVGLLTRRAVDRAMDHGLSGVQIEQLMEAGEVFVSPADSMARLQQVMMTTGWGQIPVVDQGEITGVVTRTDLIARLGYTGATLRRRDEIVRRLEAALPPTLMALMRDVGEIAQDMGLSLYVVGGFVRDLLLEQPTIDVDFVVEGDAVALTQRLQQTFGGEMRSHRRFGTGKWLLNQDVWEAVARQIGMPLSESGSLLSHIDFITARTEFYHEPTALPEVERSSIKLDLHRRDFTINTLAIRLDPHHFGQLLDFYGGERDLREGRIRVLHSLSFVDDPTRILRAVRLEQRLGFRIEPRTEELIGHALSMLDRVSGDRIRHEIELILAEPCPERVVCRLQHVGALRMIHPALSCDDWIVASFRALRAGHQRPVWAETDLEVPYFALLMYRMSLQAIYRVCKRLRVQRRTVEGLEHVRRLRRQLSRLSGTLHPSEVDALLRGANNQVLLTTWAAAPSAVGRTHIVDYVERLRYVKPYTDGDKLKAMGLAPGPRIGAILQALRVAWLDGTVKSETDEQVLLSHLLAEEVDGAQV